MVRLISFGRVVWLLEKARIPPLRGPRGIGAAIRCSENIARWRIWEHQKREWESRGVCFPGDTSFLECMVPLALWLTTCEYAGTWLHGGPRGPLQKPSRGLPCNHVLAYSQVVSHRAERYHALRKQCVTREAHSPTFTLPLLMLPNPLSSNLLRATYCCANASWPPQSSGGILAFSNTQTTRPKEMRRTISGMTYLHDSLFRLNTAMQ